MPWESSAWHRLTAGYRLMRLVPPVRLCARFGGQSVHRPAAFMSTDQRHRTGAPVLGGGSELVRVDVTAGVATMTLSDNKKRNALSTAMMSALRTVLAELEQDAAVKVGVIRHEGTVFSSGHDLKEISLQQGTTGTTEPVFSLCSSLMLSVQEVRFPVIAEVGGLATAGGCQLVAACDLAVAAESATFATPGVKIGLFCSTPGVALVRAMPVKHAMEMLLTGDAITAREAQARGLVNRVVADAKLRAATADLANKIAQAPAHTVRMGKRAFYQQAAMADLSETYAFAQQVMVENMRLRDAQEGVAAFLEKRAPEWSS